LHLIDAVRKDWGCDCIFFFNYRRINAGLNNPKVDDRINAIFGEERANSLRLEAKRLRGERREKVIITGLEEALKELGCLVVSFRFRDKSGKRTSHYLVFVSKNILGYKIMKDIMGKASSWDQDDIPSFEYTPIIPLRAKMKPFWGGWGEELQASLLTTFAGQSISMVELFDRHIVGTHYVKKSYKMALLALEKAGKIRTNRSKSQMKRMDTFPDEILVKFPLRKS
jgi:hypothetical protein